MRLALALMIGLVAAQAGAEAPNTETAGPTRALGLFRAGEPVGLEDGFADPPAISRVQCWWQCHGSAFTDKEITRQLEAFAEQGMGGVTIKDTLSMPRDTSTQHIQDIPFMSEEWLDRFAHIAEECGRLDLICRSRLGSGWNAGGPWVTPELSSQVLRLAKTTHSVAWPMPYDGPSPCMSDPDVLMHRKPVLPFFEVTEDGRVITKGMEVEVGTKYCIAEAFSLSSGLEVMSASPSGGGLHHDHLSEAGTDLQLAHVAEPMLKRLGTFDGTAFDGFNCDSWELGKPTWTKGFREAFKARRGYDLLPYVPMLERVKDSRFHFAEIDGELTEVQQRFLFDFRTTVSDLIIKTHYERVAKWCHKHGVAFEAESGGGPTHGLPKDLIQGLGAVDIPMGEFWMGGRSDVKLASSAAHAYGKRLVSLESFTETGSHFAIRPTLMKQRADEAFLLGGNYLTAAVVEYSPQEAGLPGWTHNAGPHLSPTQTWWPMARPFLDYLGRCCFLLQSGRDVADVAVYYTFRTGKGSLWKGSPKGDDQLAKRSKRYAFDYVNDDLVQNQMAVKNGRIVLDSGASYQMLYVIPTPEPTLPLDTLRRFLTLTQAGATVVWAGPKPTRSPGLTGYPECDDEFRAVAEELWNEERFVVFPSHNTEQIVPLLESSPHPPSWKTDGGTPIRYTHRRTNDADIFFAANRAGHAVDVPVLFRVGDRTPEFWIPETGEAFKPSYKRVSGSIRVRLALEAHQAVFLVCRDAKRSLPPFAYPAKEKPVALAVAGPWTVSFPEGKGAPAKLTVPELQSWHESDNPGVQHFSGIATYRTAVEWKGAAGSAATLDLGRVAEVCQVRVNGADAGIGWHAPYRFDVTDLLKPGKNTLEIDVANLWHNRVAGDAHLTKAERITRIAPAIHYERMGKAQLVPSGLIGPVRVVSRR